jgi:hypothetical protein
LQRADEGPDLDSVRACELCFRCRRFDLGELPFVQRRRHPSRRLRHAVVDELIGSRIAAAGGQLGVPLGDIELATEGVEREPD